MSGIPSKVITRCVGKRQPFTPHSQRLLVAACTEAKSEGNGKRDPNRKDPPKKKGANPKSKAKKGSEKTHGADVPADSAPKKSQSKTPYAVAKDEFIKQFLG